MYYAGKIAPALLVLGVVAGCTEQAKRPAPQPAPEPAPAAPEPDPTRELRAERGSLRVGMGPARHRLMLDAVVDAGTPAEPPPAAEPPGFLGKPERAVLDELRNGQVASVTKGSGGRTSAFKIIFDSGAQAYFKPEQNWYADVAAYYLDRALGLGRMPPTVARSLSLGESRSQVRGALIQALDDKPVPAVTPPGWENWIRVERKPHAQPATPQPSRADLPAELSDMIVFDFLTLNSARFGRNNANVLTLGAGGPLILLDNGDAFSKGPARRGADAHLLLLAKFRRRTIDAVRALDVQALGQTMAADPLGPFLDTSMLRGLETRRKAVLEHVAKQERRYGDTVYAW